MITENQIILVVVLTAIVIVVVWSFKRYWRNRTK